MYHISSSSQPLLCNDLKVNIKLGYEMNTIQGEEISGSAEVAVVSSPNEQLKSVQMSYW